MEEVRADQQRGSPSFQSLSSDHHLSSSDHALVHVAVHAGKEEMRTIIEGLPGRIEGPKSNLVVEDRAGNP